MKTIVNRAIYFIYIFSSSYLLAHGNLLIIEFGNEEILVDIIVSSNFITMPLVCNH